MIVLTLLIVKVVCTYFDINVQLCFVYNKHFSLFAVWDKDNKEIQFIYKNMPLLLYRSHLFESTTHPLVRRAVCFVSGAAAPPVRNHLKKKT